MRLVAVGQRRAGPRTGRCRQRVRGGGDRAGGWPIRPTGRPRPSPRTAARSSATARRSAAAPPWRRSGRRSGPGAAREPLRHTGSRPRQRHGVDRHPEEPLGPAACGRGPASASGPPRRPRPGGRPSVHAVPGVEQPAQLVGTALAVDHGGRHGPVDARQVPPAAHRGGDGRELAGRLGRFAPADLAPHDAEVRRRPARQRSPGACATSRDRAGPHRCGRRPRIRPGRTAPWVPSRAGGRCRPGTARPPSRHERRSATTTDPRCPGPRRSRRRTGWPHPSRPRRHRLPRAGQVPGWGRPDRRSTRRAPSGAPASWPAGRGGTLPSGPGPPGGGPARVLRPRQRRRRRPGCARPRRRSPSTRRRPSEVAGRTPASSAAVGTAWPHRFLRPRQPTMPPVQRRRGRWRSSPAGQPRLRGPLRSVRPGRGSGPPPARTRGREPRSRHTSGCGLHPRTSGPFDPGTPRSVWTKVRSGATNIWVSPCRLADVSRPMKSCGANEFRAPPDALAAGMLAFPTAPPPVTHAREPGCGTTMRCYRG